MILVNFSHPLSDGQVERVEARVGRPVERVIEVPTDFDDQLDFGPQVARLVDGSGLSARDWQTREILLLLPGHSVLAATLLAHLHGIMGHFPTVVRRYPNQNDLVTGFQVAEVINLDKIRRDARKRR